MRCNHDKAVKVDVEVMFEFKVTGPVEVQVLPNSKKQVGLDLFSRRGVED